ncbi:MAG TPA: PAS domain-containing protein [Bryobacteraceae bacterium]|nr:PAS domain-containing protein [Bryobacteraceae bacterium]
MAHRSYLRELFEGLDTGVLIADDQARYVDVNRAACDLFGRTRSELVGHHLSEFIEGARAADVNTQWAAFIRDGMQSGIFNIQLPDRSSRMFEFQAKANFVPGLHCSFLTPLPEPTEGSTGPHLTICAWTKRVRVDGKWIAIEEYLQERHGLSVSHGICPDAFAAWQCR